MKKLTALVILVFLVFSVIGCGTQSSNTQSGNTQSSNTPSTDTTANKTKGLVVAVLIGQEPFGWMQQFVDDIKISLEKNKKDGTLKDYIIYTTKTDEDANAALNDALNRKVDGVLVQPVNEDGIAASVAKLVAAGIKVWGFGASYPGGFRLDSDVVHYKDIPAQYVCETIGGKGNVIMITGPEGEVNAGMFNTVVEGVVKKYPDIKIKAKVPGGYDAAKTNTAVAALLASNPKIDGYLGEIGAMGALQAFKAANRPLPVMTGDFALGFLRAWQANPNLKAMVATYPPGSGYAAAEFLIKIIQGRKVKDSLLEAIPGRTDGAKHLSLPVPYFIVKEKDPNAAWIKNIDSRSKVITLDEAIILGEGKPDTYSLDHLLTESEVDAYFE